MLLAASAATSGRGSPFHSLGVSAIGYRDRSVIDTDEFFELESLINWGCTDPSRQMTFLKLLQSSPAFATDTDEFGITLLMFAAEAGNLEAVQQLCRLGADAGALASTGDTPLICVIRGYSNEQEIKASSAIINTLVQHGGNPNQLGWQGCSALHYAVIYGLTALVHQLLLGGADPLVRLCDPPSDQNAIELAESYRFQGNDQQRNAILTLLKMAETRFSSGAEEGRSGGF